MDSRMDNLLNQFEEKIKRLENGKVLMLPIVAASSEQVDRLAGLVGRLNNGKFSLLISLVVDGGQAPPAAGSTPQ